MELERCQHYTSRCLGCWRPSGNVCLTPLTSSIDARHVILATEVAKNFNYIVMKRSKSLYYSPLVQVNFSLEPSPELRGSNPIFIFGPIIIMAVIIIVCTSFLKIRFIGRRCERFVLVRLKKPLHKLPWAHLHCLMSSLNHLDQISCCFHCWTTFFFLLVYGSGLFFSHASQT